MSDILKLIEMELPTATDIIKAIREAEYRGYMKAVEDRPQGHYIKGRNGEWYCSNCKRIDDKYSVARFCWYCGARMRPRLQGKHFDSIIIDESALKGADDE